MFGDVERGGFRRAAVIKDEFPLAVADALEFAAEGVA